MLKFIVITDTHIVPNKKLCNGLDSYRRLEIAIDSVNYDHPDADFCVIAGDIADQGDVDSYIRFKELISNLKIPFYLTIGNHDNRVNFKKVFNKKYSDENGFIQNIINIKDQKIIVLDTCNENLLGEGKLCKARLEWLSKNLKKQKKLPTTIIMHHHVSKIKSPYIDLISLENSDDLFNILKRHSNIRHIISGHVHINSTTCQNNIPQTTIAGNHHTYSVKNIFTPFDWPIEKIKKMYEANKLNSKKIDKMTKDYEKLILLEGPAQYGVVLSDNISTTIHFHNYIEKNKKLPPSETKLQF